MFRFLKNRVLVPTGMEEDGNNRRGHHDNSRILRSHRTVVVVVTLIVGVLVAVRPMSHNRSGSPPCNRLPDFFFVFLFAINSSVKIYAQEYLMHMSIVPKQKQSYKHKCIHAQTTQIRRKLHKKGSSMNRVENNRSPIFCVCELLVSDIEEALSRSQCLRTTMQQYKLCNSAPTV